jgi:hypothetical protein
MAAAPSNLFIIVTFLCYFHSSDAIAGFCAHDFALICRGLMNEIRAREM